MPSDLRKCALRKRRPRAVYPSGTHAYCRECHRGRNRAYRRKPRPDAAFTCIGCGERVTPSAQRAWQGLTTYCTPECAERCQTRWPCNPRGKAYCKAPVPGGCDRKRRPSGRPSSPHPFCTAHAERSRRGADLTVPVQPRGCNKLPTSTERDDA